MTPSTRTLANAVRAVAMDAVEEAKSGHPDPSRILRVSIEAGTTVGWKRYTMVDRPRFGIDCFGASGPIADLYRHFGLTADQIVPRIVAALEPKGDE